MLSFNIRKYSNFNGLLVIHLSLNKAYYWGHTISMAIVKTRMIKKVHMYLVSSRQVHLWWWECDQLTTSCHQQPMSIFLQNLFGNLWILSLPFYLYLDPISILSGLLTGNWHRLMFHQYWILLHLLPFDQDAQRYQLIVGMAMRWLQTFMEYLL